MIKPLLFPISFRAVWCCGFATYHVVHDSFLPAAFQVSVFGLFLIYQIAKLVYYVQYEKFENKAHDILHKINFWFLVVVVTGYSMEFVAATFHAANDHEIFNHFCFLILKVSVYMIIELLADFFYARKINKISPNKRTAVIITLWDSIKKYFSFFRKDSLDSKSLVVENANQSIPRIKKGTKVKGDYRKPETASIRKQVSNFIYLNRKSKKRGKGGKK